ncbi:MAG: hypothetical protein M1526_04920 [Candidatus Thermoplasmatota archaeon]|jgi:NADH:ubiquinone oxidoreductase subunit 6 (subunit J)|nr:hypothetical protein [Candidatus Thermoplasmatota archaeon]MCL5681356.1 hypothetical protein [Candidatus Thermoplasmatota archaeon]
MQNKLALFFSVILFLIMLTFIQPSNFPNGAPFSIGTGMGKYGISQTLFSTYLLPFEIITFLLIAAMLGAMYLGEREVSK